MSKRLGVKVGRHVFGLTDVRVCCHLRGHWGMLLCSGRLTLNANDITGLEHVDPQGIFTPFTLSQAVSSAEIFFFCFFILDCCSSSQGGEEKKKNTEGQIAISILLCNINATRVLAW